MSKAIQICAKIALVLGLSTQSALGFELSLSQSGPERLTQLLKNNAAIYVTKSSGESSPPEIIAAVQSDYRNLIGTLYREGFYGPTISIKIDGQEAADLSLISLPASINSVVIDVDPGKKFKFGETRITPLASNTELPESFRRGETAKAPVVGAAKDAAIEAWRAQSHAKAALITQKITADHTKSELDVALQIDPGPQVKIGQLRFDGTTTVTDDRLRRISNLPEGRAFDPEDLDRVSKRLLNSGTFRSVTIKEAETLGADNSLDLLVTVEDDAPRRFGFGAEISSLDGISLSSYWLHRNITGAADRLRIDGEIAGIAGTSGADYTVGVAYRRPATVTAKTTLLFDAKVARLDEPDYFSETAEVVVGAEVETSIISNFEFGIGYRYSDVKDDVGERKFRHLIFPMLGGRDHRDDRLNPKEGTYFEAEIMPFVGLDSSASGTRLFFDGRAYKSLDSDQKFVFANRLQVGSVTGANALDVPPELLFFSGGGGTVRGQPYQSLDLNTGSFETGGTSYFGFSTELRAQVSSKFSLVGFADIGAIGGTALPTQKADWHSGAGMGVRYDTGLGPIRLDLAGPISGDTGKGLQLYLGIGQAF